MGGKSGGGARTPTIERNTLHSAQKLKFIDLISSGEIFGFKHGNDQPLKSILLNGTPIQNQDDSLNFNGVRVEYNRGTNDQDYLPSFSTIDRAVPVGAQVKKNTPITRTVSNSEVTSIRVTAGVDALMRTTKEGDQLKTSVSMTIMLMKNNVIHSSKLMDLNEKGSKPFRLDFEFDDLPEVPFEIRCVRNTEDSNDDMLRNNTYFFSYVESIDAKMGCPLSAVAAMEIDSEQFGNDNPERTYDLKGAIVQVPSNYNPEARTYSGLWDRLFKPAWTNNPVWILYDLLTDEIDGFNAFNKGIKIDIDSFYNVAKYCDELVDDGSGGKEPRFVCNAVFYGEDAYTAINNICSSFRAVCGYNGEYLTLYTDRAHDVAKIYNNSMVVDGLFEYSETELSKRYNQIQVQYADENNGYETAIDEVSDDANIALIERILTLSIVAFGATKLSYARRAALWALITSLTEKVLVSFKVGASGIYHEIYDIIEIVDNDYMGTMAGGRIKAINGNIITLDREVNDVVKFSIETTTGPKNFDVKRQISEAEYELNLAPEIIESAAFNAILKDVEPRLFRCTNIEENDDGTYTVSAIQHNPQKEAIVDNGAQYMPEGNTTIINSVPGLSNGIANNDGKSIILEWDSLSVIGTENKYRIQLFRDKAIYQTFETKETFLRLENLPQGEYIAKIRAVNSNGQYSEEITIAFSTTYKIDGLRAKPIVFGIELNWQLPALITSDAFTEIWYSEKDDRMTATKLATIVYPQNNYLMNGLSVGDQFYFWFRLVDLAGNQGEFSYSIAGSPSDNSDDILGYLDGKISEKEISKDLQDQFDSNIDDKVEKAKEEIKSEIDGIEIDLTGINSEIDNIKTDITKIDSELDNVKTDITNIDSELVGINADIAIIDSDIDSVKESAEKALSDAEKNAQAIKEQSTVIDSVSKKQGEAEANWQLAQMSNVSTQKSNFARSMTMSAQVAQNIAKIEDIDSFVVTEKEATATRFTQINTRVDNAESKITSVEQSLSSDIKAEASKREALEAVFDLSKAQQQLQLMTQATADKSLSSRLFSMSASTANAHAKYDELQEVVATNEDARVTSEQKLQAEIDSSKADITRIDRVMTSEFSSQATSIRDLSASLDDAKADIKTAEQAIVDNEKSQAKKNSEFNAQFDESEAKQQLSLLTESSNTRSLSQRYFSLSAQTANSSAKLEQLQKVFADSETAWTVTEERLQSQIDSSKSEVSRIEKTSNERHQAQSITNEAIKSELNDANAEIKKTQESIVDNEKSQAKKNESFEAKFDDNSAKQQLAILTESSSSKSFSQRYFSLSAQTANSSAKLEQLQKVFADSETAWAVTEQHLQSQLDSSKSEISRIDKTVTDNEKSQAQAMSSLSSEINNAKSDIQRVEKAQSDAEKSLTSQINSASSEWKSANTIKYLSAAALEKSPRTYADTYGVTTVTEFGMGSKFGMAHNIYQTVVTKIAYLIGLENGRVSQTAIENSPVGESIIRERQSISDDSWSQWVQSEDVAGAQAKADAAQKEAIRVSKASIDSLATTQAAANKAFTEQINSANSEIGKNKASITQISSTQATTDGKVNAMYTLKVDANSNIGGIMLGANEHESMFKVAADTFVVSTPDQSVNMFSLQKVSGKTVAALNGDLIAKGSISGDKITANTSIQAPVIKGGRVESGHFAGGSINIENGNFSVDSNGNLIAKSGRFEGTVYADKIEGDVVSYIRIREYTSTKGASYNFMIEKEPFDRTIQFLPFSAASWLKMSDRRTIDAIPTIEVLLNNKIVQKITDQYRTIYSNGDGHLVTSSYAASVWKTFRNSEHQLLADGFHDRLGVSTGEFSIDIPANVDAHFTIKFYSNVTSTTDSFVVSEIPATIYRKSRLKVVYPTS